MLFIHTGDIIHINLGPFSNYQLTWDVYSLSSVLRKVGYWVFPNASTRIPSNTNAPIWSMYIEIHGQFLLGRLLLSVGLLIAGPVGSLIYADLYGSIKIKLIKYGSIKFILIGIGVNNVNLILIDSSRLGSYQFLPGGGPSV